MTVLSIPAPAIDELVAIVVGLHALDESGWTSTTYRHWLEGLQVDLQRMREKLGQIPADLLHRKHNRNATGLDGYPILIEDDPRRRGFTQILADLSTLEEEASSIISSLPHPKSKKALSFAALGLLHLMVECNLDCPRVHLNAPAVLLLEKVCQRANLHYSRETLKGAMARALTAFDPLYMQDELRSLWPVISKCLNPELK